MTGKIYPNSSDIYEDQAELLFNYYRSAAERIVSEEERIASDRERIQQLRRDNDAFLESYNRWYYKLLFIFPSKRKRWQLDEERFQTQLADLDRQHKEIFRDYRVTRLGVAYVPVAEQVPYEGSHFVIDSTGSTPESALTLQIPRQHELLSRSIDELKQLTTSVPLVDTGSEVEPLQTGQYSTSIQQVLQHDYSGSLERSLRTISFCLKDLDYLSCRLPLVERTGQRASFLRTYATTSVPEGYPVVSLFNEGAYRNDIEQFKQLNDMSHSLSTGTEQFESVLKGLMLQLSEAVQLVSTTRIASTNKLVLDANKLLYRILRAPYNHYSSRLEAEALERVREENFDYSSSSQSYQPLSLRASSRVQYDLNQEEWIAQDGVTEYEQPFGIHQIYEEIMMPIVENLLQENRLERLKVYNHIRDQKMSYLVKWNQDTEAFYRDNRQQSADLINLMQEGLSQYIADYNTLSSLEKTMSSMSQSGMDLETTIVEKEDHGEEVLAGFQLKAQEFRQVQQEFEDFMDRLKDDITQRSARFDHVEYYDASLRDGNAHRAAVATDERFSIDERRRPLTLANPLLAKEADLPPEPQSEPLISEHLSINLPSYAKSALEALSLRERELSQLATQATEDSPTDGDAPGIKVTDTTDSTEGGEELTPDAQPTPPAPPTPPVPPVTNKD